MQVMCGASAKHVHVLLEQTPVGLLRMDTCDGQPCLISSPHILPWQQPCGVLYQAPQQVSHTHQVLLQLVKGAALPLAPHILVQLSPHNHPPEQGVQRVAGPVVFHGRPQLRHEHWQLPQLHRVLDQGA